MAMTLQEIKQIQYKLEEMGTFCINNNYYPMLLISMKDAETFTIQRFADYTPEMVRTTLRLLLQSLEGA